MEPEFDPNKVKKEVVLEADPAVEYHPPIEAFPEAVPLLEHEHRLMLDNLTRDTLFVFAGGLGVERLFLHYLMLYSSRKLLALVINTTDQDEAFFLSKLNALPTDQFTPPKILNADVSIADRQALYLQGGVHFITSRILMVDFLTDRIPAKMVAVILVYRAHQLLNTFQDAFILRLYREKNKEGRVRAFTDQPQAIAGLGQLQRLVDRLYVRHVRLVPRYDEGVVETLSKSEPTSIELGIDLPGAMRRCISLISDLLKVCLRELKQSAVRVKSQIEEDAESEAFNSGLYFVTELERRLRLKRSYLPDRQQRLLQDCEFLRNLLRIAETRDACTVLSKLNWFSKDKEALEHSSGWLFTPTGNRLMAVSQELASALSPRPEFAEPPKWTALQGVLDEVRELYVSPEEVPPGGPSVVIFVADDASQLQLTDLLKRGIARTKMDLKKSIRTVTGDPDISPLWDPDQVFPFYTKEMEETEGSRKDVVGNIQKNQKEATRAVKKRKKVAETLVGIKQRNLEHFGIMRYRRTVEKGEEVEPQPGPSTSTVVTLENEENHQEEDDQPVLQEEKKEIAKLGEQTVPIHIVSCSAYGGDRYNVLRALEKIKPVVVIMYHSDLATFRQVELFHATNSNFHLHFYFLQYSDSTEEERYLSRLSKENEAFSHLKNEVDNLLIAREFDAGREEAPRLAVNTLEAGGFQEDTVARPKIIVDMREFNSELPTILYKKGYDAIAATLEVGDYVLSPGITIERKALDDLTQSLQSGRVFKQTEQMLANYAAAYLLIESNTKFELKIVNGGPFQGELSRHCREIRQQLCTLIRLFPKLKLIWSLSPANSADYFADLKLNTADPDVERAVAIRGDEVNDEELATRKSTGKPNATILRNLTENLPNFNKAKAQKLMLGGASNLGEIFRATPEKLVEYLPDDGDTLSLLFNFNFRDQ